MQNDKHLFELDTSNDLIVTFERVQLLLQEGAQVELHFEAGTYYCPSLSLDMTDCPASAKLTLRGASDSSTVLSGASVLHHDGWRDEGNGLFSCPWSGDGIMRADPWFPSKHALGLRNEMLSLNGRQLVPRDLEIYDLDGFWNVETPFEERAKLSYTLINRLKPQVLKPGEFGILGTDGSTQLRVYLRLAMTDSERLSPCNKEVLLEAAVRHRLITLTNVQNVSFHNLEFTMTAGQAAEGFETPLVCQGKNRNLSFEHCNFVWNSAFGLNIGQVDQLHFESCSFNHNGYGGLGLTSIHELQMNNCETSYNDWRNVMGGDHRNCHCTAGIKAHRVQKALLSKHKACANAVNGIWFDVYCSEIVVRESLCMLNAREGLFFELSDGPFEAHHNLLLANGEHCLLIDVVGESKCHNNLVVSPKVSGFPCQFIACVDFGQGLRYNEHTNQAMLPGKKHILKDNCIYFDNDSGVALALHNRVLPRDDFADKAHQIFWHCFEFGANRFEIVLDAAQQKAFFLEDFRKRLKQHYGIEEWQSADFEGAVSDNLADLGLVNPQCFDCRISQSSDAVPAMPFVKIENELIQYCLEWFESIGIRLEIEGFKSLQIGKASIQQFFGLGM